MSRSRPGLTFAILALSVGSFATLQSLVVPVLPVIQSDLGTTTAGATWTMTAWLISAAVATPLLGRVGDMVGKRRILIIALAAVAVGSVIAAFSPTIGSLIGARIIQGLGGAMFPLAFGIARDELPKHRLASAIGALASIIAIGSGIGTVLAGPLADLLGWRGLFLVPVVFTVTGAVLARIFIPESPTRAAGGINPWSAVLLSSWLVALLLPLSTGNQWGWGSAGVIGLFVLAVLLLAAWVIVELRSRNPLVDIRMMRVPAVWSMNAAAVFVGAAMFAVFSFFPRFVQTPTASGYGLGASVTESGLLLLPMLVTMAVTGFASGPLSRWLGFRSQIVYASVVMGLASISIGLFHVTLIQVTVAAGVFGIGLGLVYAAITSVVVQSVPPTETGIATGMNANLRTIGSAIGAALMTAMVTGTTQPNGLPAESGYSEGFLTAGLLAFGAAIVTGVALLIARPRRATVVETLVTTPESPFAESEVEAEADFELRPEAGLEPEAESPLDTARERELEPALR